MTTPDTSKDVPEQGAPPVTAPRVRRSLLMTFLSYPYVLVTMPLLCGLIAHFLWERKMPEHRWSWREWFAGAGCITAVSVFAILAVGYLVLVVISGWRQNGRRNTSAKHR